MTGLLVNFGFGSALAMAEAVVFSGLAMPEGVSSCVLAQVIRLEFE